jgi:hypothetical protein
MEEEMGEEGMVFVKEKEEEEGEEEEEERGRHPKHFL